MKRLDGQIAWIGGGASEMGEATAEFFAKEGAVRESIEKTVGHFGGLQSTSSAPAPGAD